MPGTGGEAAVAALRDFVRSTNNAGSGVLRTPEYGVSRVRCRWLEATDHICAAGVSDFMATDCGPSPCHLSPVAFIGSSHEQWPLLHARSPC